MAKLVGIVGLIGSGKDTIANHLIANHNFRKDSFANSVKNACSDLFGWPRELMEGDTPVSRAWREQVDTWWGQKLGIPDFTPRKAMQCLGNDLFRDQFHKDFWILTMVKRIIQDPNVDYVISDVRYPNEMSFIRENGGVLIKVTRGHRPDWWATAVSANFGDKYAPIIMTDRYVHVPESEWRHAGIPVDYELTNDGSIDELLMEVDDIIQSIP